MRCFQVFFGLFLPLFCLIVEAGQENEYDGWQRTSVYVAARDGTQLALDYYRPTIDGVLHTEPLPVVWRFTPYGRYPANSDLAPNEIPHQ